MTLTQTILRALKRGIRQDNTLPSAPSMDASSPPHPSANPSMDTPPQAPRDYWVAAHHWTDDRYAHAMRSKQRYQRAFLMALGLTGLLALAIDSLIPLQHMEPLLIHHYADGRVTVEPLKHAYTPHNTAQVESDIVRYVSNRESYDATAYSTQYTLIHIMSSAAVSADYRHRQSATNPQAPINVLGPTGIRTVHIDNVVFLPTQSPLTGRNGSKSITHLAQVNFTRTDHRNQAPEKTTALTAWVAWAYRGIPHDLVDRWQDWDGFTVTHYTVTQRTI